MQPNRNSTSVTRRPLVALLAVGVLILPLSACGRGQLPLGVDGNGGASASSGSNGSGSVNGSAQSGSGSGTGSGNGTGTGSSSGSGSGSGSGNGTGSGSMSSGSGSSGSGSSGSGQSGSTSSGSGPGSSGSGPGSVASVGSGPSSSGSMTTSGSSSGSGGNICFSFDACTGCMATGCPESWCSCAENNECFELFGCLDTCGFDEACSDACLAAHPDGISPVLLVSGCAGTTCNSTCGWGNPDFDDCQECLYLDCSAEFNACFAEPQCLDLWTCLGGCGPTELTCSDACLNTYPAGIQLLEDALECADVVCDNECT